MRQNSALLDDVIAAMLEVWNGGDIVAVEDIYTDPVRLDGVEHPRGDVVRALERSRAAFPDQRYSVEERVDGRDRVVLRLTWSGTHTGTWQSRYGAIPASGRRFSVGVIELYELTDSRIAGAWLGFDISELLCQLGVELVPQAPA